MLNAVDLIVDYWKRLISLLDSFKFNIGSFRVSYISLIFAFLVVGFFVSLYWKGART